MDYASSSILENFTFSSGLMKSLEADFTENFQFPVSNFLVTENFRRFL